MRLGLSIALFGLISAFGGHAMAAGLSLAERQLEAFREAFESSVRHFLEGEAPRPEILTDGELRGAEFSLEFARELQSLEPWGQRFPEPLFEGAFEIVDQRVVGGAHLKMVVRPRNSHEVIDAIAFGMLPEDLPGGSHARFVFRLDVNHYRGNESCQLVVDHVIA